MNKNILFLLVFFSYSVNAQMVPSFLGVYDKKNPNSTGTVTFTNCSLTGKNGPSQSDCNTSYSGTSLEGDVTLSSGIQLWTVPTTATYTIEVWGAKGGYEGGCHSNGVGSSNCHGANGARMKGEFNLTSGDILRIAVGQRGESYILSSTQGGGGGGSWAAGPGGGYNGGPLVTSYGNLTPGGSGGGSYNGGANQDNSIGVGDSNGKVIITW